MEWLSSKEKISDPTVSEGFLADSVLRHEKIHPNLFSRKNAAVNSGSYYQLHDQNSHLVKQTILFYFPDNIR